jgi:hypothetical protein
VRSGHLSDTAKKNLVRGIEMSSNHAGQSLAPHLRMTPEQRWEYLQIAFEEDADWLRSLRLEHEEEAVNKSSPKEFDDEIGQEIKHSLLIPFRRTDDTEDLKAHFDEARAAIPDLRLLFSAREATPEFLFQWGAFQRRCGFVASSYYSHGDDLGPTRSKRGSRAKSKRLQRKWIAHLLLRRIEAGRDRQLAERDVACAVRDFLLAAKFPAGFSPKWFQDILRPDKQLRTTYCRKYLPMIDIRALVAEPADDIPPTDVPIPNT